LTIIDTILFCTIFTQNVHYDLAEYFEKVTLLLLGQVLKVWLSASSENSWI